MDGQNQRENRNWYFEVVQIKSCINLHVYVFPDSIQPNGSFESKVNKWCSSKIELRGPGSAWARASRALNKSTFRHSKLNLPLP